MTFKPDICIYHGDCPDGFGAAWAIWKRFGNDVKFIPGKYGEPLPGGLEDKNVLLVDFSYDRETMTQLVVFATQVMVLDHHKTAEATIGFMLKDFSVEGIFDMTKSGARLAWEWAFPDQSVPILIRTIEDRDLWKFQYPNTEALCQYIDLHPYDFDVWESLRAELEDGSTYGDAAKIGDFLVSKFERDCQKIITSTLQWIKIAGHVAPICNAPYIYASRVGNILAERDDAPFGMTYFIDNKGERVFSLRSLNSKVDVSEIATRFDGGGHRNAAGFRLKDGYEFRRVEENDQKA